MQILRGTPAQLSQSWYVDGTIVDPGSVTVHVTNAAGTDVKAAGTSTSGSGAAARTVALTTSDTANLDVLTVVWTSATYGDITEVVEVVGDLLFSEVEARAFDGGALASTSDYSDADIANGRSAIDEAFASICGKPFGLHYRLVTLDGDGSATLLLPNIRVSSVRSIEYRDSGGTTWTAFTSSELADVFVRPGGLLYRETLGTFPAGVQNIRVGYEHGHTPIPLDVRRAALMVLRDALRGSNIDDRATSYTDEMGSRTFVVTAGVRGAMYSLPEVNAILKRPGIAERVPMVG